MSATYELVALTNGTAVLLRIERETDAFLDGIQVRADGDEFVPRGKDAEGRRFTERRHLIDKACIRRRTPMRWNLHYALLEPGPTERGT